ncbi:hypothetical protein B0H11DRAFT_1922614 [Mycena galericulata]|nr:hypothetical protein B0H11DRAFT_1922614 [Mycena galericulata]
MPPGTIPSTVGLHLLSISELGVLAMCGLLHSSFRVEIGSALGYATTSELRPLECEIERETGSAVRLQDDLPRASWVTPGKKHQSQLASPKEQRKYRGSAPP